MIERQIARSEELEGRLADSQQSHEQAIAELEGERDALRRRLQEEEVRERQREAREKESRTKEGRLLLHREQEASDTQRFSPDDTLSTPFDWL